MSNISDYSGVFYYVRGHPVTYAFFSISILTIVLHLGIACLNIIMIAALRRSRKGREPTGHCLIGKSLVLLLMFLQNPMVASIILSLSTQLKFVVSYFFAVFYSSYLQ